jgi:alkaline phosphatase D
MNNLLKTCCLISLLTLSLFSCKEKEKQYSALVEPTAILYDSTLKPFYHGVASGDPLSDRVIIWTRVTPEDSLPTVDVQWQVSIDEKFSSIIFSDTVTTSPARDYTVKVDVTGLEPDKFYYYRFSAFGKTSAIGRTKTTPVAAKDSLKFAVVSCSNWEFGYFNAYSKIAEKDVDAVLHLGDYIYEQGSGQYADTTIGRFYLPQHEIVSLQDYRTRHAQYKLDAGLREINKMHPFITIWDDHEIANDAYADGALNHQPEEGNYANRKSSAVQSYYEWLPIREGSKHYRTISYGGLADLIMLDERLAGRTKQASDLKDPDLNNESRSMLGKEQLEWFENQLKNSKATWKIIGNQVVFSSVDETFSESAKTTDTWNGYPAERKKIVDFLSQEKINDIIFLTGDTHASWAYEAILDQKKYNPKNSTGVFAVEFGTPSVSSGNWDERYSLDTAKLGEQLYQKFNPHLKYVNGIDHGYMLLTLYPQKAKAEWYYVETLRAPNLSERMGKRMEVYKGSYKLK